MPTCIWTSRRSRSPGAAERFGARRRIGAAAGAAAVAAGAVLGATALTPAGHPASPTGSAQLAAFTVTKQADGTVEVTVNELRDPSALQATLRADGVPANVTFIGQPDRACRNYLTGKPPSYVVAEIQKVFQEDPRSVSWRTYIHPAALPRGTGVLLNYERLGGPAHPNAALIGRGLVYASPACTG